MQPTSGGQPLVLNTAGTTVINRSVNVLGVACMGTYVGTVKLSDASTAAGTSASNLRYTFGLPTTAVPFGFPLMANFKDGLVAEVTGTPNLVITIN